MRISELPIPQELITVLEAEGYRELYPPQAKVFEKGALNGTNQAQQP